MSEYKIGDKVYLEGKISEYDISDNTYCIAYSDYHKFPQTSCWVKDDVLHTTGDTYDKGLNDAWELAGKILIDSDDGGYTTKELEEIFGTIFPSAVFTDLTPQKALEMVKDYEEHNKIKRGDVVRLKGCCVKGIVTRVTETDIYRLFKDGSSTKEAFKDVKDFEKTGEHYDSIDEFMKQED